MFSSALEEHNEYEAGLHGYTNDLQIAFAAGRSQREVVNQRDEAKTLVQAGKFPVISMSEVGCPHTDALIGVSFRIHSVHDTLEAARVVCPEDDEMFFVYTAQDLLPPKPHITCEDDIPW